MLNFVTYFGAEEAGATGIGALGISGEALLIQLVTFIIAYLILRRYAFKPILKVLGERRELIENGVKLGEEMQRERAELDKKVTEQLQKARGEADGIVAQAHDSARDVQREAEEKARQKAENIAEEAHKRAEQETIRLRRELQAEFVGLVSEATETIIEEKVDSKKDAELIDKALRRRAKGSTV